MLTSFALIFLLGLSLSSIFNRLKLPGLLGMMVTGMFLGPWVLNTLDESLLGISADLRQLALVIILTRAGLSLDFGDLKKVGRPAILMCFVPACTEITGFILFAPKILSVTVLEAAIMGAVIAAVSPAVVVPRMIRLMEQEYGTDKCIPQLLLAGASVDDVFVIVLFTAFTSLAAGSEVSYASFLQIPLSIITGILLGIAAGLCLTAFFRKIHVRDSLKILVVLSLSFLLLELQNRLEGFLPISGLLAIMGMGITIYQKHQVLAMRLSAKYNKLWVAAEVLLFVLVGAAVDLNYALESGMPAVYMVLLALLLRMAGVFLCLLKTNLNMRERLFCMAAYTPKATVQAAIGAVPLSMGLACGKQVLTLAVLSILITAPFGAICIDRLYTRLLHHTAAPREGIRNS